MRRFTWLLAFICIAPLALAKNGAFRSTRHGDAEAGPQRRAEYPRGSCIQCHDGLHASHSGLPSSDSAGLFAPDDNNFCFTCHAAPSNNGSFPGSGVWSQTIHARSPAMFRPSGPGIDGRSPSDANKCVNCHDPHGVRDGQGVIPAALAARDSDLCLLCHQGSRGLDVLSDITKTYNHPIGLRALHRPGEETAADFGSFPGNNRHSDCSDCHNAHRVDADPAPPIAPQASNRLAGVSRVQVANGGAGAVPNFIFRSAADPSPVQEYEICFKCHSSFTSQPPGQSNLALLTNPANPSYHPIQAPGANPGIDPLAFAGGYNAQSVIFCTDCHSSDSPLARGPHGSSYRYILKRPSAATTNLQPMQPDDLCFACHSYSVYADTTSPDPVQRASRFNIPASRGHAFHTGSAQIPCFACHETHGSTRRPALIAARFPGISSYTQTATGGTCTSTCHAVRTYTLNYPR